MLYTLIHDLQTVGLNWTVLDADNISNSISRCIHKGELSNYLESSSNQPVNLTNVTIDSSKKRIVKRKQREICRTQTYNIFDSPFDFKSRIVKSSKTETHTSKLHPLPQILCSYNLSAKQVSLIEKIFWINFQFTKTPIFQPSDEIEIKTQQSDQMYRRKFNV